MRIHAKIENQLKITDLYTAFVTERTPDYNFCGESHDFWELLIVIDGDIGTVINNEVRRFSGGQSFICRPMEFHSVWVEGGKNAKIAVFTFSAENMPELKHRTFEIDGIGCSFAEQLISEIDDSFDVQGVSVLGVARGREMMAVIAVKKLELFLLDLFTKHIRTDIFEKPKRAEMFERIIKIMEDNIERDLSAEDIARLSNISVSYLQKVFIKYVGMGAISYFNRMKITYATIMLQNGMSVSDVAEKLCFSNPNYFSTVFKRIKGENPSVYKKNILN